MRAAALFGLGLAAASTVSSAAEPQITADPPSALIVTVYRAPYRNTGSIDLNYLNGFALVSETRTVRLPAGESRLRFEGVADGIESVSAIVTGLPAGVIEKNRDARLLSPSALLDATVGKAVQLMRTNRKTGKTERLSGTLLSDAQGGVVFQGEQGIEALRCSGLPETFSFEPVAGLSAHPTLSVVVRSPVAMTRQVTLSYLSRGFDWAADYSAVLSADAKSIDLGAWVTLANSNGTGFPSAHTQVVAGRVSHNGDFVPIEMGRPILARCWPRGSTSDQPMLVSLSDEAEYERTHRMFKKSVARDAAPMMSLAAAPAAQVQQEQLGDLKLYRVPERTTLASRQSKQVRLMDRSGIPVTAIYGVDFAADNATFTGPAHRWLRTKNSAANHLGLPLPSGTVAVFVDHEGGRLLQHESGIRDTAVDEEVEIDQGESADVQVSKTDEGTGIDSAHAKLLPLVPGVALRSVKVDDIRRVEVSNARAGEIDFELRLRLPEGARIVRADHPLEAENGRPIFRFKVPANQTVAVRFQTQRIDDGILRTR
ncbi:MAG TPA: hypothetical protein VGI90_09525 [Steroidobacteraceae bacterium]|jgi:hypothetical protein